MAYIPLSQKEGAISPTKTERTETGEYIPLSGQTPESRKSILELIGKEPEKFVPEKPRMLGELLDYPEWQPTELWEKRMKEAGFAPPKPVTPTTKPITFWEKMKYLYPAIKETVGIPRAKEKIKEEGIPRATFDALSTMGEAISTAPFRFTKGLIGIVSPEAAEKIIPKEVPHPTELLLKAIGKEEWIKTSKPVDIGYAPQTQHLKNIEAGIDPKLSFLMVGSEVMLDAAITAGIATGILED